jgi:outer membrane protein TolC
MSSSTVQMPIILMTGKPLQSAEVRCMRYSACRRLRVGALIVTLMLTTGVARTAEPTKPDTLSSSPTPDQFEPIDLAAALRLATSSSLDVAHARAVVDQARANRQRALVQWLPNFAMGADYLTHEGRIQQANGNILNIDRDSLFVGGGPSLTLSLSDALFAPLVARQLVAASEAGLQRATNDNLLQVAEAYLVLLRARRRIARAEFTTQFLTAEQASELRGNSKGLLPLIKDIVEVGGKDAFQSDVARLQVEVVRRREEQANALQELLVVSRELSRLLRLDPAVPLWPVDDPGRPLPVPGEELLTRELPELIQTALANRPELAEQQSLANATRERLRAARTKPLLPNVITNFSYGGFGGSPIRDTSVKTVDPFNGPIDTAITPSGEIHRFGPRTDVELGLVWRLDNFGLGNRADVREKQAIVEQAYVRLQQAYDLVSAQVAQSRAAALQSKERVDMTRAALFDDKGQLTGAAFRSIRLNFERIRGAEGRPLEVLDSIRGLNDVMEAYIQAVSDYERARLRLLNATGLFR